MCSQGDVCYVCGQPAVVEVHWPAWVAKLCSIHGPEYLRGDTTHTLVFILGESNDVPQVQ